MSSQEEEVEVKDSASAEKQTEASQPAPANESSKNAPPPVPRGAEASSTNPSSTAPPVDDVDVVPVTGAAPTSNSTNNISTTTTSTAVNEDRKRRVYVGNLAWSVSWQDLKDVMKSTGHEVTRADIMMSSDGRSKGCGIVEFATAEGAAQAVATLNDYELNGRQIFVREDREDRGGGGSAHTGGRYNHYHQRPNYQYYHNRGTNNNYRQYSYGMNAGTTGPPGRRVYVGNLSYDVTWQQLKEHMRSAGEVVFAEIIMESNGRSKGCGIVQYATEAEAMQAISTLSHTELNGRSIFVREDREVGESGTAGQGRHHNYPVNYNANSSLYVWNLSYDTSWQDLKDHMRKAGNVEQVTILTDSNDGSSAGRGIVIYQKPQDAQRAIRELQDSELNGRPLKIREDRSGGGFGGGRGGGGRHSGRGRGRGRSGRHFYHPAPPTEAAPEGTQLYVGNLPYGTNWKELKDYFSTAGEVQRAYVKVSEAGRSKGFGIVRFAKKEDAEKAIASLNGVEFQGRALDVRLDSKV